MDRTCAWCGGFFVAHGARRHGFVCNDCLSGVTTCDGCTRPLRDHVSGEGCPGDDGYHWLELADAHEAAEWGSACGSGACAAGDG